MIPPIYSLPFAPHWTTIASISRRGLPHDVYSIYSGRNTPTLESISWDSSTGIFLSSPIGTPTARWIFELRMHQEKQTIQLFPICGHQAQANLVYGDYITSKERTYPINFELAKSNQHRLVGKSRILENRYYRPEYNNFPKVDSLLLIPPFQGSVPVLLMFKTIRNTRGHDVNEGLPRGTRKYYVVVTPEGVHLTLDSSDLSVTRALVCGYFCSYLRDSL